ncbi:histone H1-like [Senna tora]|uniref:Histone H1-like n=1 Tax=Senna tora TaxID=362788 RepID=A0A834WYP1_9FABA|nr:histone H1-like [Senna tora]
MDPTSIPPLPIVTSVVATVDERNSNVVVAHGTPNLPTYKEMIHNAIATLKKRNGSSKRAIAKYIDQTFTHLPSTHSALLTLHLKRLKSKEARNNAKRMLVALGLEDELANSGVKKRGLGRPPKDSAVEVSEPKIHRSIQVKIRLKRCPKLKSISKIPNEPKRGVGRHMHTFYNGEQATSDSDDLRRKLRYFQSKVRESLVPIKGIIQELETLASMDLN